MLDRFPLDKLSPETFLANETEIQTYTNALYTMFPSAGDLYGSSSDEIIGASLNLALWGGRTINSGDSGWSWSNLRRINTFIEYSDNCKDEKLRNQYLGLVRFFRAYFYFEKVKMFGDVPWYDHTLGSEDQDLYKARDSRDYVMQKMIEDIDFAIANLPSDHSDYRVTKWTALAFKSRFCLFEGTFRKYHAGDVTLATLPADAQPYTYYLEQAADAADKFMSSSGYSLYNTGDPATTFIGLFTKYNVSDGTNKEVILARDYNVDYNVVHSANAACVSATLGRSGITRKIIASFLMKDGTRFTDKAGWETMQFVDETKDRDPRLAQSIRTPGYCRLGTTTQTPPDLTHSVTGYSPIKYFMGPEDDTYQKSYCDLILFRTAEVYLNLAEALAELGTITQTDVDRTVNILRDRVGMPHLSMADANSNPDPYLLQQATGYPKVATKNSSNVGLILEIRRERTVELMQEGFRYYDVIRWAEGHTFESPLLGMYFPGEGTYDLNGDGVSDVTLYTGASAPAGSAALKMRIGSEVTLSEGNSGCLEFHKTTRPGWTWDDGKDYLYPIPV
ncbi:MAG: RagB/SusD family nutrient uptake outer membrane protein, partial [Bacteroidales bacterium]|nr:RagB/SusD family nutrient uptake outer membrane protein [Bacteroidales bacterium]